MPAFLFIYSHLRSSAVLISSLDSIVKVARIVLACEYVKAVAIRSRSSVWRFHG